MSETTKQVELDNTEQIGTKPVGAVLDGDEDEYEVLGHASYFSTGGLVVDHSWLSDKFREHDVPAKLLPDLPYTWSAYNRAMKYLIHDGINDEWEVDGRIVNVELRSGDDKAKFIEAHEFVPGDEAEDDDGEWVKHDIGKINYYKDKEEIMYQSLMDGYRYAEIWGAIVARSNNLFERLQRSNVDSGIRGVCYDFLASTNSVKLRDAGAVYFVPAHHSDLLNSLSDVWGDINSELKRDRDENVMKVGNGECSEVEIVNLPVFNSESERNRVERQVKKKLESEVKDALTKAFNRVEDDDVIEKIVSGVVDSVQDSETISEEYSLLLNSKISVKEIMEDLAEDMAEEQHQEFVEHLEGEIDE